MPVYPSGQRGLTVNQMAKPSEVRILQPAYSNCVIYRCLRIAIRFSKELADGDIRPHSSAAEHFFGKEEVMGPIPIVGFAIHEV